MTVHVVTDSVASIPQPEREALEIEIVSLFVNDGERHEADVDLDPEAFYKRLADMAHLPTSSQPSVESLVSAFKGAIERGCDVVGVFISERMSGTVETARMAAQMVLDQLPAARIEIVDSRSNSMQEGFCAIAAAKAAEAGATLERCVEAAVDTIGRTRYLFVPATLEYLKRGGRIGTAGALLGTLLQIKPILTVRNGQTEVFARVRTQSRALAQLASQLADDMREYGLKRVVVHYIADRDAAVDFAAHYIEPLVGFAPEIVPVSPVVGLHVGPAVAVCYETERAIAG